MPRLAWVFALGLLASIPAVALEDPPLRQLKLKGSGAQPFLTGRETGERLEPYNAPKVDGPVIELLDESLDPLFPLLNDDGGGQAGTISREDRDVFAGVEAARVTQIQKFCNSIRGWAFRIIETPKAAGEFRYLRFAWKKIGGTGIMIQFHSTDSGQWGHRFVAGQNTVNWQPAISTSAKLPAEWEVVTRDLFKDFGACVITGFALTAMDGTAALFDHMLLGRSDEDLDKATNTALGKVKPEKPLAGKDRDTLWANLIGTDRPKAAIAIRAFLASAPVQVEFIRDRLATDAPDKGITTRIRKLLDDLDADDFDTRDAATDELVKIGAPALDAIRALATNGPNDEVRFRARLILKKLGADGMPVTTAGKMARVVRVLERAGTKDARALLTRLAEGEFGFDGAPDAKAALIRMPKLP